MKIKKSMNDQMTPIERKHAIEDGKEIDRIPCVPFMSEFKCVLNGICIRDFWQDSYKMAEAEILTFNRYGHDRLVIGPNTRGITEALGGKFVYPDDGIPYADVPYLKTYDFLNGMEPVNAFHHPRIQVFARAAELLSEEAAEIVPIEASIGGPFTIAANLRGVERLLRDCRKYPEEVHKLLRIVADSQKSCIDMAAIYGLGIAMADPVANPALIGPEMYETFVYPYTKEVTEYAFEKTGHKVSLHMCGKTYRIWEYLVKYKLNEISLDNIVDLGLAAQELGESVPIAGNVDPVGVILQGTKEEIQEAVYECIRKGEKSRKGYTLTTGCDIPETTDAEKIDYFMAAARTYRAYK